MRTPLGSQFDLNTQLSSPETERTILGAMLLEAQAIREAETMDISAMSLDSHRTLLTIIRTIAAEGTPVDLITLTDELKRQNLLGCVGGHAYLASLTEGIPRRMSLGAYIGIVQEKAALRGIIGLCEATIARAQLAEPSSEILHDLYSRALECQEAGETVRPVPIAEIVVPVWEEMKRQRESTGEVLGIPTGIPTLDRLTTGWRNGELTYVGALPGRGKTSFMLQAMYAAASWGFGVGCISLEMRKEQLLRRLAVLHSRINAQKFRDVRTMNASEFDLARRSVFALGDLPMKICDHSGLNPAQISSLARQMYVDGAKVIFVDFVQIIREDGKDRREAINRVSAALRDTCKELDIPFIVTSQLARRDADPNRRPTMQDLRESGNLEQDAHNVIFLYRPIDKFNGEWTGDDQIIIDKQREGMTGAVPVRYSERSLTFAERS